MRQDYVISSETVLVMSVGKSCCKIYELEDNFEVNMSLNKIINLSCNYFGSSFQGRIEGSKYYLGDNYKLPFIVDEYREIIAFPIKSYRDSNNAIILLNQIKDYEKTKDGIIIYTKNNNKIEIKESFGIFENQYLKSQRLLLKLKRIKNTSI